LREGGDGTRTRYNFIVKENGGRTLAITPCQGVTEDCVAHAINHTCHSDFANCKFLHTGISTDPRGGGETEDEGLVGGRRTSVLFCEATRQVERDADLFFLQTTGPSSGLLVCVCAICVRRKFSVNFPSSVMNCYIAVCIHAHDNWDSSPGRRPRGRPRSFSSDVFHTSKEARR
jgi:hypothetical protein